MTPAQMKARLFIHVPTITKRNLIDKKSRVIGEADFPRSKEPWSSNEIELLRANINKPNEVIQAIIPRMGKDLDQQRFNIKHNVGNVKNLKTDAIIDRTIDFLAELRAKLMWNQGTLSATALSEKYEVKPYTIQAMIALDLVVKHARGDYSFGTSNVIDKWKVGLSQDVKNLAESIIEKADSIREQKNQNKSGLRKLTDVQVQLIRRIVTLTPDEARGKINYKDAAILLGVHNKTVYEILNNKTYKTR